MHGLFFHTGKVVLNPAWSIALLITLAVLSIVLIVIIVKTVAVNDYRLFLIVFYVTAVLFFTSVYFRQLNISYEARHFRILGLMIVPGIIYLAGKFKPRYQWAFMLLVAAIAYTSFVYVVKGFVSNSLSARGIIGLTKTGIDQRSLNTVMKLDKESKNATFVFIGYDTGLEIIHNRAVIMPAIGDDLKINPDDYTYLGFAGPLYIVLPKSYNGTKGKMIMNSFPGYTGFNSATLSNNYVLYSANMKK